MYFPQKVWYITVTCLTVLDYLNSFFITSSNCDNPCLFVFLFFSVFIYLFFFLGGGGAGLMGRGVTISYGSDQSVQIIRLARAFT